ALGVGRTPWRRRGTDRRWPPGPCSARPTRDSAGPPPATPPTSRSPRELGGTEPAQPGRSPRAAGGAGPGSPGRVPAGGHRPTGTASPHPVHRVMVTLRAVALLVQPTRVPEGAIVRLTVQRPPARAVEDPAPERVPGGILR